VLQLHLVGGPRRNVLGRSTIERIESLVEVPPTGTRVIVITADEPDFCAGYDLREAASGDAEDLIAHDGNFRALRHSSVPVIVALHGNVIGGGLELALSADVRIAAPGTKLSIPAGRLGLVYSESGAKLFVGELGESTTRAMLLSGYVLGAEDARLHGTVAEIVPSERLIERALELAESVASWSPVATAGNRRLLDVITGRVEDDTAALRLASFAPEGELAASIERFVTRQREPARRNQPLELLRVGSSRLLAVGRRINLSRPRLRTRFLASAPDLAATEERVG
jgi:enoyl-CoA hydratase/carnithine racemase